MVPTASACFTPLPATLTLSNPCRHMVEQDVKVHLVLRVMGLSHAADTLVGDNLLRGVSGG